MKDVCCVNCVYVFRRKRDGKYFRGSYWWRWTRHWRCAAVLNMEWWHFALTIINETDRNDGEFVNVNDILNEEVLR